MIEILPETTKKPLQLIGRTAGICWGADIKNKIKNIERSKDCIKSGHGRVEEWVEIHLLISGYSARCMREFERHVCGASFLQESTRYVNMDQFDYVLPMRMTAEQTEIYVNLMKTIKDGYKKLIDSGVKVEDAANVLPLGSMTKIVDKRNLRNMVNLMNQRLCARAYPEIRILANEICMALKNYSKEWGWIVDNLFLPKCEAVGYCTEKKSCGHKAKREDLK